MAKSQPKITPKVLRKEITLGLIAYRNARRELKQYEQAQKRLDEMISSNQIFPESIIDQVLEEASRFYTGIHSLKNCAEKLSNLRELYITYNPNYDLPKRVHEQISFLEDDAEIYESKIVGIICRLNKSLLFSQGRILLNR